MDQPFQAGVYVVALIVTALLTGLDIVSNSIRAVLRMLEREALDGTPLDDAFKAELKQQAERKTTGKVIGTIESAVYLYALVSNHTDILAGALAFKGFTGWLAIQGNDQQGGRSLATLVRFYVYAIGNFMSLLWAVLAFEAVRALVTYSSDFHRVLWVSVP